MKDREDQLPWYKGVYSLRLGGAEFIQGIDDSNQDRAVPQSSTSDCAKQSDPPHAGGLEEIETCGQTGVSWIAGHHAVAMERADPESLIQGVKSCFKAFPAVQLPDDFQASFTPSCPTPPSHPWRCFTASTGSMLLQTCKLTTLSYIERERFGT